MSREISNIGIHIADPDILAEAPAPADGTGNPGAGNEAPTTVDDDKWFWRRAAFHRVLARFPATRQLGKRGLASVCSGPETASQPIAVAGELAGIPLMLDLRDTSDRDIYLFGGGDPRGVSAIERVMARLAVRTAWDIGANRGNHAAFMRRHCERLFCFEPNPGEYRRLADLFRDIDRITPVNLGLSSIEGRLPFHIDQAASGGSSFELDGRPANFEAEVNTGDHTARAFGLTDIDFLKIDVEGHEIAVLRGLRDVIRNQRPVIVMEILEANNRSDSGLVELLPGYRFFGNRIGLLSGITRSAYSFCRFRTDVTYMSALLVPEERLGRLEGLLPS